MGERPDARTLRRASRDSGLARPRVPRIFLTTRAPRVPAVQPRDRTRIFSPVSRPRRRSLTCREIPALSSRLIKGHDRLTVEFVEPPDLAGAILLRWPAKVTACAPDAYANVAASMMQIHAAAVTELAGIRA